MLTQTGSSISRFYEVLLQQTTTLAQHEAWWRESRTHINDLEADMNNMFRTHFENLHKGSFEHDVSDNTENDTHLSSFSQH